MPKPAHGGKARHTQHPAHPSRHGSFPQGFDATLAGHLKTEELVKRNS
ncbi:hypothetical protein APY03_5976 [Variovorax sp. WDL1]|nr:hypothetical protein APY03_5976 [Variovorax sp. WDL1]